MSKKLVNSQKLLNIIGRLHYAIIRGIVVEPWTLDLAFSTKITANITVIVMFLGPLLKIRIPIPTVNR